MYVWDYLIIVCLPYLVVNSARVQGQVHVHHITPTYPTLNPLAAGFSRELPVTDGAWEANVWLGDS